MEDKQEYSADDVGEVKEVMPEGEAFLTEFAPARHSRLWTSLEDANDALRMKVVTESMDYLEENPQPIQHIIVHDARIVDDDGVVTYPTRCVVITPEGRAFHAISAGVLKSLQEIAQVNGAPPWDEPITLQLLVTKLSGARQFKQLIPVKK